MGYDIEQLRRTEFPSVANGDTIYLNNASTGPLPERAVRACSEWARLRANPLKISHEFQFGTLDRSRELIAKLVGADVTEIALATNTSFGLNLAAFSLPLKKGDVVLSLDGEFPANVYPWMALAERRGVAYRQVKCDEGVLDVDRLRQELDSDDRVRAVTVSWVQFASGARVDLASLGALCRERGVFFIVDAIQGLGPLTLDLSSMHVDILACGAQKWLLSPWGSGFVYVRRELIQNIEPHDVSWMGVRGADDFNRLVDYDLSWRESARKFEFVTVPFQDLAAMNASLELFLEVGPNAISKHALGLVEEVVQWTLGRDDMKLVTPADPSRRAGIVSICPRDAVAAHARLDKAGVAHSMREGSVRLSPHFYNTSEEVCRALEILAAGK